MKIIFMGSPAFGLPTLMELHRRFDVAAVYSQPPRASGRTITDSRTAIHAWAESNFIPVRTPESLRSPEEEAIVRNINPDLIVVAAYGNMVPQSILDIPRLGCWNIHASLLPRWRGAAPIQRAIMAGDENVGVSLMKMERGLDTGPVIAYKERLLASDETATSLHDWMADEGVKMVVENIAIVESRGFLTTFAQDDHYSTYAQKLSRDDGRLDWNKSVLQLDRLIRAVNPWPGAFFDTLGQGIAIAGERVKVMAAKPVAEAQEGFLDIRCADGWLRLETVQRPGKRPITGSEYLHGCRGKRAS